MELGFIGCGSMGQALLNGWLAAGRLSPEQVAVSARRSAADTAERFGVRALEAREVVARCRLLVLAVKPHQAEAALTGLPLTPEHLVVSVMAGVPRERTAAWAAPARVVRAMPNVSARVGQGVTLVLGGPDDAPADVERVRDLFATVGHAEVLADEAYFHAATALVGSGPAYLFVAMEAMADGAVAAGLPRAAARRLAAFTARGAGALAAEDGAQPGPLKDSVASPGGTTIAALRVLERRGFRGALLDAVVAAAVRARELEER